MIYNYLRKIGALLLPTLSVLMMVTMANANERSFAIDQNFSACSESYANFDNTRIRSADFRYDDVRQEFYIDAVLKSGDANGFQLMFNSESALENTAHKMAGFYIDASQISNANSQITPKVNAFIYSRNRQNATACENNPGSWSVGGSGDYPTEAILPGRSGYGGNPAWVQFASATLNSNLITVSIVIKTEALENFVPNTADSYLQATTISCTYKGRATFRCPFRNQPGRVFDFGSINSNRRLSLLFVPSLIQSASYNGNGQLTNFQVTTCSQCYVSNKKANQSPVCEEVTLNSSEVFIGEEQEIRFKFSDQDRNDRHTVEYFGLPAANTTAQPAQGSQINSDQPKEAVVRWTPQRSDLGLRTIGAVFIQNYGNTQAGTALDECSVTFEVKDPPPAICQEQSVVLVRNQAKIQLEQLKGLLYKANKVYKRLSRKNGNQKFVNFKGALKNHYQTSRAIIDSVPDRIKDCSSEFGRCEQIDFGKQYQVYLNTLPQLYCDGDVLQTCNFIDNVGKKLFKKLKNEYRTKIMNKRGLSRRAANKKAKARVQRKFAGQAAIFAKASYDQVVRLKTNYRTVHFVCP